MIKINVNCTHMTYDSPIFLEDRCNDTPDTSTPYYASKKAVRSHTNKTPTKPTLESDRRKKTHSKQLSTGGYKLTAKVG